MFRRREILHIGTDFGNDSDGSKSTADTRSGLKNGKLLLIGGGERKNEFLKLCLPGFKVFIMSLDYLEFTSLFGCDMAVNGITQFKKFLFQAFENKGFKVKGSICGISKSLSSMTWQICRRCPKQRRPTGYWKP